jgi:integrase
MTHPDNKIQSRAPSKPEPATGAGFSFLNTYGDTMGTKVKYLHYRPAKLYNKGKKWFVWYQYRDPSGQMKRFKVYEGLNQIKGQEEKKEFGENLVKAVNYCLSKGYNPFTSNPDLKVVKEWSLIQAINYYKQKIPDLGLRLKTMQGYYSFVDQFTSVFAPIGNKPIEEIDRQICANALSKLKRERGWGNTMYNNGLTFGRLMFSYFIQNGICKDNPFKSVKPLQETKTQNQPFSDKDFELIKEKADPELLKFLMFLYHTGTRPNEARQLTYEHILRDRKMLYIPGAMSKGKKDGYVPVSDQFLDMFYGHGSIFGSSKNKFTLKFTALKRKLKLNDKYTLYSIKATRAVHLAEDGASPYAIMQLFRHSSLDITMHYLRDLGINIGREAADKVR